jgi:hypothetical protein
MEWRERRQQPAAQPAQPQERQQEQPRRRQEPQRQEPHPKQDGAAAPWWPASLFGRASRPP